MAKIKIVNNVDVDAKKLIDFVKAKHPEWDETTLHNNISTDLAIFTEEYLESQGVVFDNIGEDAGSSIYKLRNEIDDLLYGLYSD